MTYIETVKVLDSKDYDVYVGRRGRAHWDSDGFYGNPFTVGVDGNQSQVVKKYKDFLLGNTPYEGRDPVEIRRRALIELKGKRLYCPCKGVPCHADVLVELVNLDFKK